MLYEVASNKPLEEIDRGLHEAAARHGFGVITVHDLRETMRKKGVEFGPACRIYEVCNPHQARKVLEANGAVSTALPCRISVYGVEGGFRIATIKPTAMMAMFDSPGLADVAREVEDVVVKMIDESA
ncbi:MAG: DUF302 domain-containing protein [Bryobacteraceae bacterium]|nr:DUF302 domain-containing protein [Bryobacteraceae bacterium]